MMIAPQRKKNKCIVSVAHFTDFFNRKKTFRPRKRFAPGTMRHCLHKRAERSMLSGVDLDSVVKLPPSETLEDWIAVHVVDFFNRVNLIFATVYDYCTPSTCPVMNGGARYEYYWMDGKNYRKPTALPASRYIELVLEWIETSINDESQFPTSTGKENELDGAWYCSRRRKKLQRWKVLNFLPAFVLNTDVPFPPHFIALAHKIFSRLYRVFVHLFIHHYEVLVYLNAEAPVLTCYRHFYRFITHFNLVSERELSPLSSFSAKVCGNDDAQEAEERESRDADQSAQNPNLFAPRTEEPQYATPTKNSSRITGGSSSSSSSTAHQRSSCTSNCSKTSNPGSPPLLSHSSPLQQAQSKLNCAKPIITHSGSTKI